MHVRTLVMPVDAVDKTLEALFLEPSRFWGVKRLDIPSRGVTCFEVEAAEPDSLFAALNAMRTICRTFTLEVAVFNCRNAQMVERLSEIAVRANGYAFVRACNNAVGVRPW